jgi:hypothetical protein
MKGIDSTGAPLVHVPGWMGGWVGGWVGGWMGGWVEVKAVLRIAYSNQKIFFSSIYSTCPEFQSHTASNTKSCSRLA